MWPDWAIVESSWQNLLTKVAQYDSWLLGYLKKINKCKNWCEYFLVNFFTTISGRTGHDSAFTTFLEKLISLWPSSFSNGRWPFDFNDIGSCSGQCDQIGQFLKSLGDKFSLKSSQNLWKLFGLQWKASYCSENYRGSFWGKFWKILGYFLFQHMVTLARHVSPKCKLFLRNDQ